MNERITINPNVCSGEPCVKGTRVPARMIAAMHANGDSIDGLLEDYPHLAREDILAAIEYVKVHWPENTWPD